MNVCLVGFIASDFANDSGAQKANQAVLNRGLVIFVVNLGFLLEHGDSVVNGNVDRNVKRSFALAAVDRKNAVGLEFRQRLRVIPVHFVGGSFFNVLRLLSFGDDSLCDNRSALYVQVVNRGAVVGVLRDALGDDVLCAVQCVLDCGNVERGVFRVGLYKLFGFFFESRVVQFKHSVGKGVQAFFDGDHAARLLLFLEGSPKVFKLAQSFCAHRGVVKAFGQFVLRENSFYDFQAALFQIFVAGVKMVAFAHLQFVKRAVALLAVARDKGNGAAFGHQRNYGADLLNLYVQLLGDALHDFNFVYAKSVDCFLCEFHKKITPTYF